MSSSDLRLRESVRCLVSLLGIAFIVGFGGLCAPTASASPGWVDCGDPGEGRVVFIADLRARFVTCSGAEGFARSYERKAIEREEFFPHRHQGFQCFEHQSGVESNRFNCGRGTKRITFILGL